jgi:hypothetical protein
MRELQAVWAAAFDLAWKLGVIVIAIGLCALMPSGEARDDAGRKAAAGATNPDDASLFGDDVRVTMDVRGRPFAHCTVRAADGGELARINYSRTGVLTITLGDAFPTRAGAMASTDGTYRLEVGHAEAAYRLKLQPGGASGFAVDHRRLGIRRGLGLTPEGELIHDPTVID